MDSDPVSDAMLMGTQGATQSDPVSDAMLASPGVSGQTSDRGHFNIWQAGAAMAGGTLGSVIGGYRGLWDLASGKGVDQATQDVQSSQQRFTPAINQATGEILSSPRNPLTWIPKLGSKAAEAAFSATGSPGLATAADVLVNAAPAVLGFGLSKFAGAGAETSGTSAAIGTVNKALTDTSIDPQTVTPALYQRMVSDVQGGAARPAVIQAEAEADQIGTRLSEGQAAGDAAQYAKEINLSKVKGGEPYADLFRQQNQDMLNFIDNTLGAKTAATPAEAGQNGLTALARIDQQLDAQKNAAYALVRDSQGRSATLDAEHFYMNAQASLEHENLSSFIPPKIGALYDDINDGKLPLNVDTMMSFDKVLSRAQRTLTDGNETYAVGLIRKALADTPVSNAEGQQSITAYNTARSLARQQFELADPKSQNYIPGYAAMLKGMGNADHDEFIAALENGTSNADPAAWFKQNVLKATPAGGKKMVDFLNNGGAPDAAQGLGNGTLSAIRDQVVKGTDVRASISADALNKVLSNRPTLQQFLPQQVLDGLDRLANTASRIQTAPYRSGVGWSNTATVSQNLADTMKEMGGAGVRTAIERNIPGGRLITAGKDIVSGARAVRGMRQQALTDVNPSFAAPPNEGISLGTAESVPLSLLIGSQGSR